MISLITAMLAILATWVLWWFIFIGVGLLAGRLLRLGLTPLDRGGRWFAAFWSGWAATVILLEFWHFVRAVNLLAAGVVIALGLAGWIINRKTLWTNYSLTFYCRWSRREWLIALGLALVTVWTANRACDGPAQYDSGLYHMQAIRWTATYPIVPGLGNLHGRLAFNQTYFLYAALLGAGPWAGRVGHVANGLLLLPLIAQLTLLTFGRGEGLSKEKKVWPVSRLLAVLLLAPALEQTLQVNISSPSPDMPVFILGAVLMIGLLPLLGALVPGESAAAAEDAPAPALITRLALLGFVCPTVKLNLLVLGLLAPVAGLAAWWWRRRPAFAELRRLIFKLAALFAVAILPWLGRDVLLSGWLGFPAPWLPVPVAWRMPRADVADFYNGVRSFARNPLNHWAVEPEPLGVYWVMTRVLNNPFHIMMPLIFVTVVLGLLLAQERLRQRGRLPAGPGDRLALWLFTTPALLSVAYWFVSAPDPRFCGAGLWLAAAGPLAFMLIRFMAAGWRKWPLMLALALVVVQFGMITPRLSVYGPGADHGFRVVAQAPSRTYVTASGLTLYRPVVGDQCWDAPLPATPYPRPGLRLRQAGGLARGFAINPGREEHGDQMLSDPLGGGQLWLLKKKGLALPPF